MRSVQGRGSQREPRRSHEENGRGRTTNTDIAGIETAGFRLIGPARVSILGDWQRLSSEESLVGLEVDRLKEPHVGRDGVSGLDLNDVTDDNLGRRDGENL